MFAIAFALAACPAGSITPAQAREDLELAISAAEAGLPDIYWRQSPADWTRRKAEARAAAAKATSEEQLFRALAPLMRGIGEGHLSVTRSDGMNCRYRETAKTFPLDLLWRDLGQSKIIEPLARQIGIVAHVREEPRQDANLSIGVNLSLELAIDMCARSASAE